MNGISSIGVNLYSLQGGKKITEAKESPVEAVTANCTEAVKERLNASDILSYMATTSLSMKIEVKKGINVNKYVDQEQYERIGNMMKEFEASVEEGLKTFNGEFPNLNISESAKLHTVLNTLER